MLILQAGRVSPRNSSRGGNYDTQSKVSNSPINSSPLHREMGGEGDGTGEDMAGLMLSDSGPNEPTDGARASANSAGGLKDLTVPPPSSSSFGGNGMGMTAIREEREMST